MFTFMYMKMCIRNLHAHLSMHSLLQSHLHAQFHAHSHAHLRLFFSRIHTRMRVSIAIAFHLLVSINDHSRLHVDAMLVAHRRLQLIAGNPMVFHRHCLGSTRRYRHVLAGMYLQYTAGLHPIPSSLTEGSAVLSASSCVHVSHRAQTAADRPVEPGPPWPRGPARAGSPPWLSQRPAP